MIKVNDTIILDGENLGESYSFFDKWFEAFNLFDTYERKLYGDVLEVYYNNHPDDTYTCIWIAPHFRYTDKMLYAIQSKTTNKIFLVNESVICNNIHTYSSYDPCKEALKIICNNYRKVIYDEADLKERYSKLQKRLEELLNPMPALENGMYGVINIEDSEYNTKSDTFVVYGGKIITSEGIVFSISDFKNGCYENACYDEYYRIVALYNENTSMYDIYKSSNQIWKID